MAYSQQSNSLKFVQKFGPQLERAVVDALGWTSGRVVYFQNRELTYDVQIDACYPDLASPQIFVSVTYCKPDKPGHSNENKLQLKLGELMLLKAKFPTIRSVLILGGNKHTWLSYILEAFDFFFDTTVFAWEDNFDKAIEEIRSNPNQITLRHGAIWEQLANEWGNTQLWTQEPINSYLRISMWEQMSEIGCEGELPEDINNDIFRECMQAAFERHKETRGRNGKEWTNYLNDNWKKIWESRSFFNPAEAAIKLALSKAGFAFKGGLAQDEEVPSLIHHLGGENVDQTKVSEDFILYSRRLERPVFIQSKSTGGGMNRHGKNIQNRTKEQIARSLFYRGAIDDSGEIYLRPKDYYWIGVLDGNWGVTKKTPFKYLHMLQWAGYDFLTPADSLVNDDLMLKNINEIPLINKLQNLDCLTVREEFESKWSEWCEERFLR